MVSVIEAESPGESLFTTFNMLAYILDIESYSLNFLMHMFDLKKQYNKSKYMILLPTLNIIRYYIKHNQIFLFNLFWFIS